MDKATALQLIDLHTTGGVSVHNTAKMFANVSGITMASISMVTPVKTAAKSPLRDKILKVTSASVMLANNLKAYTDVYLNKVKRTATEEVTDWVPTATYFHHTDTYCITQHNTDASKFYLFAIFNNKSDSVFINTVTNSVMTREEVAAEMTPSEAKKLLDNSGEVYNKTNDVTHQAIVRTVSLANVVSITMQGNTYKGSFTYA